MLFLPQPAQKRLLHSMNPISQFFILSPRGDTIVARDYLGNVPKV